MLSLFENKERNSIIEIFLLIVNNPLLVRELPGDKNSSVLKR